MMVADDYNLNTEAIQFFKSNGYLLIRNVFNPTALIQLRDRFDADFSADTSEEEFENGIIYGAYQRYPELIECLYSEKVIKALQLLLGHDIVMVPEPAVHRNRYFDWHKDIGNMLYHNPQFKVEDDYPMVQLAMYFQDNGKGGGGLTVLPGSQSTPDRFSNMYYKGGFNRLWHKVLKLVGLSLFQKLNRNAKTTDIPSIVGDLLVFDLKLDHRSTFPKASHSYPKYAVFTTAGNSASSVREYQSYLRSRPEPYYEWLRASVLPKTVNQKALKYGAEICY